MNTNKLLYILLTLTSLLLIFGLGVNLFVDKVSDRVIQKLKQDYSPSPYGPTIDPDKIDLNKVNIKINPSSL
jgi:hypothetical protein